MIQINFSFPVEEEDNTYLCEAILGTIANNSILQEGFLGYWFPANLNWDANLWKTTLTPSTIKSHCKFFYTYHKNTQKKSYWGFQVAYKYNTVVCVSGEDE